MEPKNAYYIMFFTTHNDSPSFSSSVTMTANELAQPKKLRYLILVIGIFLIYGILVFLMNFKNFHPQEYLITQDLDNLISRFGDDEADQVESVVYRRQRNHTEAEAVIIRQSHYHPIPRQIQIDEPETISTTQEPEVLKSSIMSLQEKSEPQNSDNSNQTTTTLATSEYKFDDKHKLIILVLSSRDNFKNRAMIRKTWAENYTDVYFMVGQHYCQWPTEFLVNPYGCSLSHSYKLQLDNNSLNSTDSALYQDHLQLQANVQSQLLSELQSPFNTGKLVLLDMLDTYNNLTLKTKMSFQWAYQQLEEKEDYVLSKQKYFMKIDDDCILRIKSYAYHLNRYYKLDRPNSKHQYLLAGKLESRPTIYSKPVLKKTKWAEFKYNKPTYPPYANGNSGYTISFSILKYFAENFDNLIVYQNEDASTGIWIDESYFKNKTVFAALNSRLPSLQEDEEDWCDEDFDINSLPAYKKNKLHYSRLTQGQVMVLGHRLDGDQIYTCWNRFFKKYV